MYQTLIVDDEKPVRIAVSKLGKWAKYHCHQPAQTENGKEALQFMWEMHPELVFLDMQMPVMNGVEFLQTASKQFPDTAFIVISGYDNFSYLQNALRCGAIDYLLKPIIAEDLNSAMERALKKLHPEIDFSQDAKEDAGMAAEDVVSLIKDTIDRQYSQNIRITDFADKYFFSKEYLSKLFKAEYKSGIYEYLLNVRMERAARLLSDQEIQVQDVAKRVGYSDNNYFSKAFKTFYNLSPSEYRRQHT